MFSFCFFCSSDSARSWLCKWRLCQPAAVFSGLLPILEDVLFVFCRDKVRWCFPFCERLIFQMCQGVMNFATPFCTTSSNIDALMDISKFGTTSCLKLRARLGTRGLISSSQLLLFFSRMCSFYRSDFAAIGGLVSG